MKYKKTQNELKRLKNEGGTKSTEVITIQHKTSTGSKQATNDTKRDTLLSQSSISDKDGISLGSVSPSANSANNANNVGQNNKSVGTDYLKPDSGKDGGAGARAGDGGTDLSVSHSNTEEEMYDNVTGNNNNNGIVTKGAAGGNGAPEELVPLPNETNSGGLASGEVMEVSVEKEGPVKGAVHATDGNNLEHSLSEDEENSKELLVDGAEGQGGITTAGGDEVAKPGIGSVTSKQ